MIPECRLLALAAAIGMVCACTDEPPGPLDAAADADLQIDSVADRDSRTDDLLY